MKKAKKILLYLFGSLITFLFKATNVTAAQPLYGVAYGPSIVEKNTKIIELPVSKLILGVLSISVGLIIVGIIIIIKPRKNGK